MFKFLSFISTAILLITISLTAQEKGIYVSPEIQKIYNGETRSWDGKPGPVYWQNSTDYYLKVTVDPDSVLVSGEGKIVYHNNSPDTLNRVVIRLYQDIFKKGVARDFGINEDALTDGTKLKKLEVNGNSLDPDSTGRRTYTNYILKLSEKLTPQSNLEINIAWEFTLTDNRTMRMGKYRDGGLFIAYWYPQIAVYDDVDGWDMTEYTGQVEFYNDFNNYEVEITVPENYLVRATGDMLNGDKILLVDVYQKYEAALKSDEVVGIITLNDIEAGITNKGNQTWKYKADYVSDFTFACVKDYLWDGVSTVVDEESGRRTLTDVLYKKGDAHFEQGAYFSKLTVDYLSNELPGVPFPYTHITSFCNGGRGGGMESPMMTNDGAPKDSTNTLSLLFHEIAHTYFPFYMGINERKYAWMDEGWATFLPTVLTHRFNPNYSHYKRTFRRYKFIEGTEGEVPPMILSKTVKGYPLVAAIYGRAYFAYVALEDLLGAQLFKKAMKEYINRWHGKHPLPYDFFFTFNGVAGEDLSWFWNPWFYENGFCDLSLKKNSNGDLIVKMIGNQPVPVTVKIIYDDGTEQIINKNTMVWESGDKEFVLDVDSNKKISSAELDVEKIPDLNEDNNKIEISK